LRASLVRIGNSRGIRIPRPILDQLQFGNTVELEVQDDSLLIKPVREPRLGWDDAFRRMAEHSDDELLDAGQLGQTDWDRTEWEW
jgi:antitoxin MazE